MYNHSPRIITDGLIFYSDSANPKSYLGFGDAWNDISGNNHVGTLFNGVGYDSDNNGFLTFDGVDDWVNTGTFDYFSNWTDPVTISIWCRVPTDAIWSNGYTGNIIGRGSYTGSNGLVRFSTNNRVGVYFRSTDGTVQLGYTGVVRDTWFNLSCTWDGINTMILYFNGASVSSTTTGVLGGTIDIGSWIIGLARAYGGAFGNYFQGDISNIMFYNRPLNETEITQNYNTTKSRYGL